MHSNYLKGGYGYGHAKKALYELIMDRFKRERELYNQYMSHPDELESRLQEGAVKARMIANTVMERVREKLGYNKKLC